VTEARDPNLPEITLGLQLYSVRDAFAAQPEATLEQLAGYGYRNVEWFGGLWGRDAASWRRILDDRGLRVVTAHVPLEQLTGDEASRLYDDYRTLGCHALICPYLDEYQRAEDDCFETVGKALNAAGYRAIAEGFRLGYHNHDFEYLLAEERGQALDGIEQILSWCSCNNVAAELDVFWAAWAGRDPVASIEALACAPDRLTWLHLKDGLLPETTVAGDLAGEPEGPGQREPSRAEISYEQVPFRELGAGDMPLAAIVEAANRVGVETLFIEQDFCRDSFLDGDPLAVAGFNLEVLESLTDQL
jgi:sugar phosphate isomerase/epimerase